MTRLPPEPLLDWSATGTPISIETGDVYSSEGGLEEKRTVFLDGCGLPDAWRGRDLFTVGELGFGSGLSFLALWDLWRTRRPFGDARLHVVSFERALMSAASAERAHAPWEEVQNLARELRARWPDRANGVQRLVLPDGVVLTLHVGPIESSLPRAALRADAWFLDGFSPARNPEMWSFEIMRGIARLSAPGARAATYTVAGPVRRALAAAGFTPAKRPGAGRKRERLEAVLTSSSTSAQAEPPSSCEGDIPPTNGADYEQKAEPNVRRPLRALVIGAGIAGAASAYALAQRGCQTIVVDKGLRPGAGASGNPTALLMPRLDVTDTPEARGLIEAYLFSRRIYLGLGPDAAVAAITTRRPGAGRDRRRFERLLADPPLTSDHLKALDPSAPGEGLRFPGALAIRPEKALTALLAGSSVLTGVEASRIRLGRGAEVELSTGERLEGDVLIVCAALSMSLLLGPTSPPMTGRLGQIEAGFWPTNEANAEADGGYVVCAFDTVAYGATFEPVPDEGAVITSSALESNRLTLKRLRPDILPDRLPQSASRASVRATTPDRLPFAGPIERPDAGGGGGPTSGYMIGGLGSHGYLWAPFLAEAVTSRIFGEPSPAEADVLDRLSPHRFKSAGHSP
ncbi:MAG: tRNA (5-methylaminomethyl-2-thiouridine)(34)-methyltransferase MnmD [Alphaproteobacteria bacterium]|nr:tRNA (5-methylaminomethyl-2-thiouridine)(34)-methyltransferase MnmD [Alphaproteobacteria bacterium]